MIKDGQIVAISKDSVGGHLKAVSYTKGMKMTEVIKDFGTILELAELWSTHSNLSAETLVALFTALDLGSRNMNYTLGYPVFNNAISTSSFLFK